MTIGCDLGNRIVGIMGGDAIMAEFEKYAKPMPQAIPLSVLQEIRAEIDSHCSDNRDRNDGLYIAMKIIDKYKAESEETDGK